MRSHVLPLLLIAGCATTIPTPPPTPDQRPSLPTIERVVHYSLGSSTTGERMPPSCEHLELSERVIDRTAQRERAIEVRVTGGNDKELCGVGGSVLLVAGDAEVQALAVHDLPARPLRMITGLHRDLGRTRGSFTLASHALPWTAAPKIVTVGWTTYRRYLENLDHAGEDAHGSWDADAAVQIAVRDADEQLVCARYASRAVVQNFEWGGYVTSSYESLYVDYGGGPKCAAFFY